MDSLVKEEKLKHSILDSDDIYEGIYPKKKIVKPEFGLASFADLDSITDTNDPTCPTCLNSKIDKEPCCDTEALRRIMEE